MSENGPAAGLSPPQLRALRALVTGSSVTPAATAAGVHPRTVHAWCRSHELFRSALDDSRRIQDEDVIDQYRGLATAATAALRDILSNPKCAPGVRLKASLAVLEAASAPAPREKAPEKSPGEVTPRTAHKLFLIRKRP